MTTVDTDQASVLARNLVDLLTLYEEELLSLESAAPRMGQLRRAVGMCIAEAHYLISDHAEAPLEWRAADDGRERQANR